MSLHFKNKIFQFCKEIAGKRNHEDELGFWIFHPDLTLEAIKTFKAALPNINLYYAVKCNPNPLLVKFISENGGDGFDCASLNEIKEVIKLGINPEKITYSQNAKTSYEILESYKLGVRLTLVDSNEEVDKLSKLKDQIPEMKIMIRIQSNDPTAEYSLGGRFGLEEDEIDSVLQNLSNKKLNMCGIHFHIGSGAHSPEAFRNGLRIAKETIDKAKILGYKPDIIDIGGGFSHEVSIENFGKVIIDAIHEYDLEEMKFIAEPGRYLACNSFSYVANIVHKHKKKNLIYYTICEGVHGAISCAALFQKTYDCVPLNPKGGKVYHSIFGGQTCDSHDIVTEKDIEELNVGDWVVYYCLGAYSMSLSCNFNGFESRTRPVFQLPLEGTRKVVKLPLDIEKNGIPALWGLPNTWDL